MNHSRAIRSGLPLVALLGLIATLFNACATVPPGHAAIVTWPIAGVDPTPLRDGDFWVGPLAHVDMLDLRRQERNANFLATLADGTQVQTGASIVTYRFAPEELPALLREIGPNPYTPAISPLLQSTVRRVLGALRLEELDTPHLRAAQLEITRIAAARLRPLHILLDGVDLRQVAPLSPQLNQAIIQTGVLEQTVLRAPDDLRLARQRADELRTEAAGIAAAHAALAPTLDERALRDLRTRAWGQLLSAPLTRTIVLEHASSLLEVSP